MSPSNAGFYSKCLGSVTTSRPRPRHSGIRYVGPAQRHDGQDQVYEEARERNPRRWARGIRNSQQIMVVTLNSERDAVIRAATADTAIAA
jgi:hypothetical protein